MSIDVCVIETSAVLPCHIWYISSHIPLSTICTFLAGGALLWPTVLHVRF